MCTRRGPRRRGAVQIVHGPARAAWEALTAAARQRLAGGQGELDLGLAVQAELERVGDDTLGFHEAADHDEVFIRPLTDGQGECASEAGEAEDHPGDVIIDDPALHSPHSAEHLRRL